MARYLLALLIAFSLLPLPGGAAAVPVRDCAMAESGMAVPPASHDEGCCTDQCVMVVGSVLLPSSPMEGEPPDPAAAAHWGVAPRALHSSNPAADPPPPRI